jgi:hypothetical protein
MHASEQRHKITHSLVTWITSWRIFGIRHADDNTPAGFVVAKACSRMRWAKHAFGEGSTCVLASRIGSVLEPRNFIRGVRLATDLNCCVTLVRKFVPSNHCFSESRASERTSQIT